jgi:hypothetical protein
MTQTLLLTKIVTGGQTGTDRAVLDVAIKLGIPWGGWCPKGRLAEDGMIAEKYKLKETPEAAVEQRTEFNARDSDGTLILLFGSPTGGTLFTIECAEKHNKPYYLWDTALGINPQISDEIEAWRSDNAISVLNVAGPRESLLPGTIYSKSYELLHTYLCITSVVRVPPGTGP